MSVLGNIERADQSRSAFVFASHSFPAIGIYDKQKSLNTVSVIEHSDLHALVYCLLTHVQILQETVDELVWGIQKTTQQTYPTQMKP